MPKQITFASLAHASKKKVTRREKFLAEMEVVVPWRRLLALIEPHYPKMGAKGGRPAMPLEVMLRIYCLQQWYALSDPMAEECLYDSEAMRRFTGLELADDRIPDETTILMSPIRRAAALIRRRGSLPITWKSTSASGWCWAASKCCVEGPLRCRMTSFSYLRPIRTSSMRWRRPTSTAACGPGWPLTS